MKLTFGGIFRDMGLATTDSVLDFMKIDHMKLDTESLPKIIYGTTRSADFSKKGNQIYVFIVTLDEYSFDLNDVQTFVELIMPIDSYVSGINDKIINSDKIFFTYFVPSTSSLYYAKFNGGTTNTCSSQLLFSSANMENGYIRETIFAGNRYGSMGML